MPFCMICGKEMPAWMYDPNDRLHMMSPRTVDEVHSQLQEKDFPEPVQREEQPKPIRRGKQGIARRDGPRLF
jgi:hypothetical protein